MTQNSRGRSFVPTRVAGRAVAAGLSAGLVASVVAFAGPASATATVNVTRAAGATRYGTSAAVSAATFSPTTADVVIASGENFPDGLSASALAGALNAPVLLVPAKGNAPQQILDEIARLKATDAWVVGGTGAVSDQTANSLGLTVHRLAGADRIQTAIDVAAQVFNTVGIGTSDIGDGKGDISTVILARKDLFADALAASALADAGHHPILLTDSNTLTPATQNALVAFGVKRVIIMGGTGAVSDGVKASVAATAGITDVQRVGGADRAATARALADLLTNGKTKLNGSVAPAFTANGAVVATGWDFPDALSAGPHAGVKGFPILFTKGASVPQSTKDFFTANRAALGQFTVVGGTGVVPDSAVATLKAAATTPTAQAGLGDAGGTVASVDKSANSFIVGTGGAALQYNYDSNDLFKIGGVSSTLAAFEAALSTGDSVTADYRPAAADSSIFDLTDATPAAPVAPGVADDSNASGKPAGPAALVSFSAAGTNANTVKVYRALSINKTDCAGVADGSYMLVGSVDNAATSFRDTSVSYSGAYCYALSYVLDGQESVKGAAAFQAITDAPAAGDTTRPTLSSTSLSVNGGFAGQVDAGDTIKLVATKKLAIPGATASILVKDADGTFATITNDGVSASFAIDGTDVTGKTLLITVKAAPTVASANPGSVPGVQVPATIVDSSGITDTAVPANSLSLASGDTSIN